MKKYFNLSLLIISWTLFILHGNLKQTYAQGKPVRKVVLDAGHGGSDIGAQKYKHGKHEKDLTLDIALMVGDMIKRGIPDLDVVYTRTRDERVELKDRHAIANKANADLFVSIHVNSTALRRVKVNGKWVSTRETEARGTETFVLGLHRVGQKSKAFEQYGEEIVEEPGLLDPNDPMTQIIVSQYTQAFLSRSIVIADKVEQNFIQQGRPSRGVKQMGLEVLAGSAMPGILIEIGFINNPIDEAYMNSPEGQREIAVAIYKAIRDYKTEIEKGISN